MDLPDPDGGMSLSELLGVKGPRHGGPKLTTVSELPQDDDGMHEWQVWGFHNECDYKKALAIMGTGPSATSSSLSSASAGSMPNEGLPQPVGACCGSNCVSKLEDISEFMAKRRHYTKEFKASFPQKQDLLAFGLMKESMNVSKAFIGSRLYGFPVQPRSNPTRLTRHSDFGRPCIMIGTIPDSPPSAITKFKNSKFHLQNTFFPTYSKPNLQIQICVKS